MPKGPVCILGAGYSSGWVSSCFHFPSELLAVELLCKAKGGAPPIIRRLLMTY
jgi:hypothetical protein